MLETLVVDYDSVSELEITEETLQQVELLMTGGCPDE